jgi:hypothetical protein
MPVYRTSGKLTGTIEAENVSTAQRYLTHDHDGAPIDMAQYLDPPLKGVVELLEWSLDGNGHDYTITAFALRELNNAELKQLSEECSGQNSDGLGEGFEQQAFAEQRDGACGDCDDCANGYECEQSYGMISFDWQTNDLPWTKIA